MLCGKCAQGFKQSFVTDGCVRDDGVECNEQVHAFFKQFFIRSTNLKMAYSETQIREDIENLTPRSLPNYLPK